MALLDMALRPASALVSLGREATRTAGRVATDASLATLDALLSSRLAAEAVERVLASELARTAVNQALESELARATVTKVLEGPLVEAAAEEVVRAGVVERVLTGPLVDAVARDVARLSVVQRVVDEVLTEQAVEDLLARSETIELPERVAVRIFADERLLADAVDRLLASPALWQLVDEIAQSPAVTAAITAQSAGFADEVAGGLRARTRRADNWLEGRARRALRKPRPETP